MQMRSPLCERTPYSAVACVQQGVQEAGVTLVVQHDRLLWDLGQIRSRSMRGGSALYSRISMRCLINSPAKDNCAKEPDARREAAMKRRAVREERLATASRQGL